MAKRFDYYRAAYDLKCKGCPQPDEVFIYKTGARSPLLLSDMLPAMLGTVLVPRRIRKKGHSAGRNYPAKESCESSAHSVK